MTSVYTFKRSFGLPVIYCDTAVKVFNFYTEMKLFHVICISPGIYTFRIAYKKVMCLNYRDKKSEKKYPFFIVTKVFWNCSLYTIKRKRINYLFLSPFNLIRTYSILMKSFLCPENGFKSKNNINLTYYSMNLQIAFILMSRLILHVPKSQLAFFIFQNYQLFHQHKDHTAIDMSDHIIRGKATNITKGTNWNLEWNWQMLYATIY